MTEIEQAGSLIGPRGTAILVEKFGAVMLSADVVSKRDGPRVALALLVPMKRFRYAMQAGEPGMVDPEAVVAALLGLLTALGHVYGPEVVGDMLLSVMARLGLLDDGGDEDVPVAPPPVN